MRELVALRMQSRTYRRDYFLYCPHDSHTNITIRYMVSSKHGQTVYYALVCSGHCSKVCFILAEKFVGVHD
jgi:hypothetical protein